MIQTLLLILLSFSIATSALAQQAPPPVPPPGAPGADGTAKASSGGPRKQLATIIFAGLGGAILGLSTLSFYGRPQEKLSNIAIGFAFGIIVGTSYVTYKAASNPAEFYGTAAVSQIEREQLLAGRDVVSSPPRLQVGWTF